ncbi:MAG: hypothetical protein DIZ80_03815 [endosymbiont of Galathealinum brachiosum]|uniref:GGDEF domain-containing protein n=1 Tax=endosymbiont of Galathealinum brachiosum TaxID=2200906 RepID=A0A370DI57_9GAMM|nr:MAG: hypothetical protein DIZ80_03815 [endosymbiont of Galathealinum brachiosum]
MLQHTGFSLKKNLIFTLLILGGIGIFLVYLTINQFRILTYENQKTAIEHLLDIQIYNITTEAITTAKELALSVQQDLDFQHAMKFKNINTLDKHIQAQQNRYFVTMGFLKIKSIFLYDKKLNLITTNSNSVTLCQTFINEAKNRQGANRSKIMEGRCFKDGKLSLSILVPVGSIFNQLGYIQIIIDPAHNLHKLEEFFNYPIKLSDANENTLYQSKDWNTLEQAKSNIHIIRHLTSKNHPTALKIELLNNMQDFESQLNYVRNTMIIISMIIIVFAMFISFVFLRQSTLGPLQELTKKIHQVRGTSLESDEKTAGFSNYLKALASFYEELDKQATTDSLTNLPNRIIFNDRLKELILRSKRNKEKFALMFLDLNDFKIINDTYGHIIGDQLLKKVVMRIQCSLRDADTVCRLGGDEFTILIPGISHYDDALVIAKKITECLSNPYDIKGQTINSGASIGIAIYPDHHKKADDLINIADEAMYHAKENSLGFHLPNISQH